MTLGDLIAQFSDFIASLWPLRVVRPWQQGIRVRGGKVTGRLYPGTHWFWPLWGDLHVEDTVLDVNTTEEQTVESNDGQCVTFALAIRYRIVDLALMWVSIQDHQATIANEVTASAAGLVRTIDYDELCERLPEEVYDDVAGTLEGWGVQLDSVSIYTLCRARPMRVFLSGI